MSKILPKRNLKGHCVEFFVTITKNVAIVLACLLVDRLSEYLARWGAAHTARLPLPKYQRQAGQSPRTFGHVLANLLGALLRTALLRAAVPRGGRLLRTAALRAVTLVVLRRGGHQFFTRW